MSKATRQSRSYHPSPSGRGDGVRAKAEPSSERRPHPGPLPEGEGAAPRSSVWREFRREQLPLVAIVLLGAFVVGDALYDFVPGDGRAFPIAGVVASAWHLVAMGLWTGYVMALVGQASGTLSLSYAASVLQYTGLSLSPTSLLITCLNPLGALLGFWRARQWNLDMALWLCVGAVLGAPFGPLVRVYVLPDPAPFKAAIGLALLITAVQLAIEVTPWFLRRATRQRAFKEKYDHARANGEGLRHFRIVTVERSLTRVRIAYWGEEVVLHTPAMLAIGFIVGISGAALGIGGGFLLVPILAIGYGLPLYVIVAASIPYVIVLSIAGLLAYLYTLPWLTGISAAPDWAFGLYVATGAILGAWLAAKTQRHIPETFLKPMLAAVTAAIGALYVVNYFYPLPFGV